MMALAPARGTRDLFGDVMRRHSYVVDTARRIAALYGCSEWSTPIFEDTRVFARSLGADSDVVSKEMYSFEDRSGASLTLRPEGTAGICRALVSNGLTQTLPQKVLYTGPMFRHERPQLGRYRQFTQVGAEWLGPSDPLADAEAIAMGRDCLEALGVLDRTELRLNTLGDPASRAAWRIALLAHFEARAAALTDISVSETDRARMLRNPFRILDGKSALDRALSSGAPSIVAFLTPEAQLFWDGLRRGLDAFGVAYVEDPSIVRGLDYYVHTAFEFVTTDLGSQGTVLGGGRYDGLVAEMGGPSVPGVGWAAGVDRLALLLQIPPVAPRSIAIIPLDPVQDQADAVAVLRTVRQAGLPAEIGYRGHAARRLADANKAHCWTAIFVDGTADAGYVQIKDLDTGIQITLAIADLTEWCANQSIPMHAPTPT